MTQVSQALIDHDEPNAPPTVAATETAAIFQIIERAARDQTVDIDKMKELMAMRNAMKAEDAELAYDRAMAAAQEEMQPVRADANNPQTKSRYASYAALDAAIRPIYTKHGFSVSFDTGEGAAENFVRVVAKVAHSGGHRERPKLDMPADSKGAKGGDVMTKTHATGSAIQYGRRYLLGMIFNLAVSKEDDGNGASAKPQATINEEQQMEIRDLISASAVDEGQFLALGKVERIADILAVDYSDAVRILRQRIAKRGQA